MENSTKTTALFSSLPTVYSYDKYNTTMEFKQFKYENINYDVFFELKIDKDKKHKNMIVEVENNSYFLIQNISNKILSFESLGEINDLQTTLKREVQNAF